MCVWGGCTRRTWAREACVAKDNLLPLVLAGAAQTACNDQKRRSHDSPSAVPLLPHLVLSFLTSIRAAQYSQAEHKNNIQSPHTLRDCVRAPKCALHTRASCCASTRPCDPALSHTKGASVSHGAQKVLMALHSGTATKHIHRTRLADRDETQEVPDREIVLLRRVDS